MKKYIIILTCFLLASCSDYIDTVEKIENYDSSYSEKYNKYSNMNNIENNVKIRYEKERDKLELTQLEVMKKKSEFNDSLEILETLWHKHITYICNSEFPIDKSRGSIAVTENILCLTTATELHNSELKRLLYYDLTSTKVTKDQEYKVAICSFYKKNHRKECFDRIEEKEKITINLGNSYDFNENKDKYYFVRVERSYIYKSANDDSITSSYFIKDDRVDPLSIINNWVEVSYLNGSKKGWLKADDLNVEEGLKKDEINNYINFDKNKNLTNKDSLESSNIISVNGVNGIKLLKSFKSVEDKSDINLKSRLSTDECYTESSHPEFQLLFLKDILISISFFDSNYQTDKGFKVGDKVSKLLNIYPEVEYHEYISNSGDETYYVNTKYYTTKPNEQGNAFTFHVSDSDPNTISIITIDNYLYDRSACDDY